MLEPEVSSSVQTWILGYFWRLSRGVNPRLESGSNKELLSSSHEDPNFLLSLYLQFSSVQFSSVQSLSRVRLFVTPGTAAHQASLSITNSWSSLKLMSIKLVMPSSHLILCCSLLLPPSSTITEILGFQHHNFVRT